MKKRLSQLTMSQYVDMVCGDVSVLHGKAEVVSPLKLQETRIRLMYDFSVLASSSSAKKYLTRRERVQRASMEVMLFQCCNNLYALGAFDEVRKVMTDYGIRCNFDDQRLYLEIEQRLQRAKRESERLKQTEGEEDKEPDETEIRDSFDRQTASLMGYFKFQIDLDKMPASQYACLIDQADREIKARLNALSR